MAKNDKNRNKPKQKPQSNGEGDINVEALSPSTPKKDSKEYGNYEVPLNQDDSVISSKDKANDKASNQDKEAVSKDKKQKEEGPSVLCKLGYVFLPYKKKYDLLATNFDAFKRKYDEETKELKESKIQIEDKAKIQENDIKSLSSEIAKKEDEVEVLKKNLEEEKTKYIVLTNEKNNLQEQLNDRNVELQNKQGELSEAKAEISRLKAELKNEKERSGEKQSSQSTQVNYLQDTIRENDAKIKSLSNDLKVTEEERDNLKFQANNKDSLIQNLRNDKVNLQCNLDSALEELEKFKKLNPETVDILSLKDEVAHLKQSHEAALKDQLERLKSDFQKTVDENERRFKEEKKQAVEEARQPLLDDMKDLNEKLNKAKEDNQQVRNNAKKRLDDLKAKHEEELKENNEKHRHELQTQREEDKNRHELRVKDLKVEYEAKLEKAAVSLENMKLASEEALKIEKNTAKQKLDAKDAEIADVKIKAEGEKAKLFAAKKEEQERADRLYSRLEGQLKWILNGIVKDIKEAWPEGKEGAAGFIVDDILSQNDMITLNEYVSDFIEPALESVKGKSEEELDEALNKVYRDLLSPKRPTWLDSLLRLDALVRVPFIASQFSHEGLDVQKVQRAADKANALLAFNGITTDVPKLFSDIFDRDIHEAQPIKDISTQVDDVASHVKDPETLIDIFTIGYHSEDGKLYRRPAVSRLNA